MAKVYNFAHNIRAVMRTVQSIKFTVSNDGDTTWKSTEELEVAAVLNAKPAGEIKSINPSIEKDMRHTKCATRNADWGNDDPVIPVPDYPRPPHNYIVPKHELFSLDQIILENTKQRSTWNIAKRRVNRFAAMELPNVSGFNHFANADVLW